MGEDGGWTGSGGAAQALCRQSPVIQSVLYPLPFSDAVWTGLAHATFAVSCTDFLLPNLGYRIAEGF